MTTMELIGKGIGHNCLSDAYDLGRAEAIDECKKIVMADCTTNCEYLFAPDCIECMCKQFEQLKEHK